MGLISMEYLESVLGSEVSEEDLPKVQRYIDIVSEFVKTYTGLKFTVVTEAQIKAVADGKGIIEIPDLISVETVELRDGYTGLYGDVTSSIYYAYNSGYYGSYGQYGFGFDGMSQIYGLRPKHSYRITCSYGRACPEDVKGVIALLVLAGSGLDATAVNGLKSYRVGDVEEFYGIMGGPDEPTVTLSSLMTTVLSAYRAGDGTLRL